MADISTFSRAKDWAIVALIGMVLALLGTVATDNRRRIELLEDRCIAAEHGIAAMETRQARVEEGLGNMRSDIVRRLDRIEDRLSK